MEDQGKRLLITVGLVAVLYLVWTTFFMPKPEPQAQAPAPQAPAATAPGPNAAAPAAPNAPAAPTAAGETPAAPPAVCDPTKEESPPRRETPDLAATGGAGLRRDLLALRRCAGELRPQGLAVPRHREGARRAAPDRSRPQRREPVVLPAPGAGRQRAGRLGEPR